MHSNFIVFEGLNGCGKGIAVDYANSYFKERKVFDLREYWRENRKFPEVDDIRDHDIFLSSEPTHAWVGAAIRQEMFYDNGRDYTGYDMLSAYALDRLILYKRLLIPLRDMGKIIIQERTISTTLIQQPIHPVKPVSIKDILRHPSHQYILENFPDKIVVYKVDPVKVTEWLSVREKQENDIYEQLKLQKIFQKRWESNWFRDIFEKRGTVVEYLDNYGSEEEFNKTVKRFYEAEFRER